MALVILVLERKQQSGLFHELELESVKLKKLPQSLITAAGLKAAEEDEEYKCKCKLIMFIRVK